jgi:hypothetical protein
MEMALNAMLEKYNQYSKILRHLALVETRQGLESA